MYLSIWVTNKDLRLSLVMLVMMVMVEIMVAGCQWLRPSGQDRDLHTTGSTESTKSKKDAESTIQHPSKRANSADLLLPPCDTKSPPDPWFWLIAAQDKSSPSDGIKLQLNWQAQAPYKFAPKAPFRLKLEIEGTSHQANLLAATPKSITFESSGWAKPSAAHTSQTDRHRLQSKVSYELTAFVCEASHQCFMKTVSGKLCPK